MQLEQYFHHTDIQRAVQTLSAVDKGVPVQVKVLQARSPQASQESGRRGYLRLRRNNKTPPPDPPHTMPTRIMTRNSRSMRLWMDSGMTLNPTSPSNIVIAAKHRLNKHSDGGSEYFHRIFSRCSSPHHYNIDLDRASLRRLHCHRRCCHELT